MCQYTKYIITFILFFPCVLQAQMDANNPTIPIGRDKNTYIQFKGTQIKENGIDIGGEKDNVLWKILPDNQLVKFKTLKTGFPKTTMLIVTTDTVYRFNIEYNNAAPKSFFKFTYHSGDTPPKTQSSESTPAEDNAATDVAPETNSFNQKLVPKMLDYKRKQGYSTRQSGIIFILDNIFVDSDNTYLVYRLKNITPIDFKIRYRNIDVTTDPKGLKSSASTSVTLPAEDYKEIDVIPGKSSEQFITRIQHIALTNDQYLHIVFNEGTGFVSSREVQIKLKDNSMNRAITL